MSSPTSALPPASPARPAAVAPTFALDEGALAALAETLGCRLSPDPHGPQADLPRAGLDTLVRGSVSPLFEWGCLRVTGRDALNFLHNQLTNDVEHLPAGQALPFGFCSAKGRLQASLLGWRADTDDAPGMRLALSRGLAAHLRQRLSMFVLRAKAKVEDEAAQSIAFGLTGAGIAAALEGWVEAPAQAGQVVVAPGITAIALPSVRVGGNVDPIPRAMLWVDAAQAPGLWSRLSTALTPAAPAGWRWLEVLSGVARVVPATWEHFVPQMVNFELVGGVNFKKGCYPGQEVVARSQYLGKLKRRMYLGQIDVAPPAPSTDVIGRLGAEPCGEVVLSAPAPEGGGTLLFESQSAAVAEGGLSVAGQPIRLLDLPYPLPA